MTFRIEETLPHHLRRIAELRSTPEFLTECLRIAEGKMDEAEQEQRIMGETFCIFDAQDRISRFYAIGDYQFSDATIPLGVHIGPDRDGRFEMYAPAVALLHAIFGEELHIPTYRVIARLCCGIDAQPIALLLENFGRVDPVHWETHPQLEELFNHDGSVYFKQREKLVAGDLECLLPKERYSKQYYQLRLSIQKHLDLFTLTV